MSSRERGGGLRNSRIVRVSRSFGGKDRHSKVCTIRGLRDRRIRLSVPTAIQLYDLQDRLGLSQPSKVVDWLLNAAQLDIDNLPPLQFPQKDPYSLLPKNNYKHGDDKSLLGENVDGLSHFGGFPQNNRLINTSSNTSMSTQLFFRPPAATFSTYIVDPRQMQPTKTSYFDQVPRPEDEGDP